MLFKRTFQESERDSQEKHLIQKFIYFECYCRNGIILAIRHLLRHLHRLSSLCSGGLPAIYRPR